MQVSFRSRLRILGCLAQDTRLDYSSLLGRIRNYLPFVATTIDILLLSCSSATILIARGVTVTALNLTANIDPGELFEFLVTNLDVIVRFSVSRCAALRSSWALQGRAFGAADSRHGLEKVAAICLLGHGILLVDVLTPYHVRATVRAARVRLIDRVAVLDNLGTCHD